VLKPFFAGLEPGAPRGAVCLPLPVSRPKSQELCMVPEPKGVQFGRGSRDIVRIMLFPSFLKILPNPFLQLPVGEKLFKGTEAGQGAGVDADAGFFKDGCGV